MGQPAVNSPFQGYSSSMGNMSSPATNMLSTSFVSSSGTNTHASASLIENMNAPYTQLPNVNTVAMSMPNIQGGMTTMAPNVTSNLLSNLHRNNMPMNPSLNNIGNIMGNMQQRPAMINRAVVRNIAATNMNMAATLSSELANASMSAPSQLNTSNNMVSVPAQPTGNLAMQSNVNMVRDYFSMYY